MQQKKIIIFITVLFIVSSIYLFARSSQYKMVGDWWALSFVDPKSDNLNFVIENFSANPNFHWEMFVDKDKFSEGNIEVESGTKKEIMTDSKMIDKKTIIRVSNNQETKEIYKNPTQ